jgi:hypothetical protein
MAKPLVFKIDNNIYELEPLKLERKKLYGTKEKEILDANKGICTTASISTQFNLILPKGSTALGSIDSDGNWLDKNELIVVDQNDNELQKVPSSFDAPIELHNKVSIDEYLNHNIISVYSLQDEENSPEFVEYIKQSDDIYTFDFNYRADYEADPAFVIENNGELFVLVGKKIDFEFIGMEEFGQIDETDDDSQDEDEFDFGMM